MRIEKPTAGITADETNITEITLQADGNVYVFGLSREVLEIIHGMNPNSVQLNNLLEHVQAMETRRVDP